VEFDAPEEDVLLLDISFMSQAPEATMHVPSYAAWLEQQDNTPAYAYLRRLMQLLSWQRPAENWVLKSPHHMEYIDTVLDVFPDATIVQTHATGSVAARQRDRNANLGPPSFILRRSLQASPAGPCLTIRATSGVIKNVAPILSG
jgi:hypothetical protein